MSAAAKCRFIGNMLEFTAARTLAACGGTPRNCYTREKMTKWQSLYSSSSIPDNMPHLTDFEKAYDQLEVNFSLPLEFELANDSRQDTTDLSIYNQDKVINISLKNNNTKLKHQRPKALHKQVQLSLDQTNQFQREYQQINDHYYNLWTQQSNITLFKDLDPSQKQELYDAILDLTIKWLQKDPKYIRNYIHFVTPRTSSQSHVLCWNPDSRCFTLIHKKVPNNLTYDNPDDYKVWKESTFLYISFKNEFTLKIRIHNASSRITKTLQIKYDTTIKELKHEKLLLKET